MPQVKARFDDDFADDESDDELGRPLTGSPGSPAGKRIKARFDHTADDDASRVSSRARVNSNDDSSYYTDGGTRTSRSRWHSNASDGWLNWELLDPEVRVPRSPWVNLTIALSLSFLAVSFLGFVYFRLKPIEYRDGFAVDFNSER